MQIKKQQLEMDMEQRPGSKLEKESACWFNLYAEYIIQTARLDKAPAGIKIASRNINNLRYVDDRKWRTKEPVDDSERGEWKRGHKTESQKTKIMASGPITSWKIGRETIETVTDFILGGSKITADGDCSHERKRHLPLGRKVMTNLERILKSSDVTF